jgi:copper resistance protein C
MQCRLVVTIILSLAAILVSDRTWAHAQLRTAVPAVGGVIAASPGEIRLGFSEGVEIKFSSITLTDARNSPVATESAVADPNDRKTLILKLRGTLSPGIYRVDWKAVSVDSHKTTGTFTFTVKP